MFVAIRHWTAIVFVGIFLFGSQMLFADAESVIGPPKGDVLECELSVYLPDKKPRGVLMVMDGENQSASRFTEDEQWSEFAKTHELALVGVKFVSEERVLRQGGGYYDASADAGKMLLDGLAQAGLEKLPIYVFGFSGGARFANSFVAWKPEVIAAWAAYSATVWTEPNSNTKLPPGIVACGQFDGTRYAACQGFVQRMRKADQPITWVSLEETGHQRSLEVESFARDFFAAVISQPDDVPVIVDNTTKTEPTRNPWHPSLTSKLPSASLLDSWRALHHP